MPKVAVAGKTRRTMPPELIDGHNVKRAFLDDCVLLIGDCRPRRRSKVVPSGAHLV